jgi:hypothetical protein
MNDVNLYTSTVTLLGPTGEYAGRIYTQGNNVLIDNFTGGTGATGPTGETGATGAKGDTGPTGTFDTSSISETAILSKQGGLVTGSTGLIYLPSETIPEIWSALGSGLNSVCYALTNDSNNNLYAGGLFTTAGGTGASRIAKWDGSSWSALSSGLDGINRDCYALTVDSNNNVYAGGYFTTAGGTGANRIAKWDGSNWSALGSGLGGTIPVCTALTTDSNNNLYAGGTFTTAGGTGVSNIAKWDGSSWSALGSGLDGSTPVCNALTFDNIGNLYAGGNFTTAGGTGANNIAKWDGSSWSALGSGLNGVCTALTVDSNNNVYAGGYFTTAGGTGANRIAKWDGSNWSALGSGLDGSFPECRALTFDNIGNLYAGGNFTTAGGTGANRIAKWDGSNWSALGSGINSGICYSLTLDSSNNIYAGGSLFLVGGISVNNIAKYQPAYPTDNLISVTGVSEAKGYGLAPQIYNPYVNYQDTTLWYNSSSSQLMLGNNTLITPTGNLLHVDTVNGNDTLANISPYVTPFKTVEAAVNKISGLTGKTIMIYPGTYEIGSTGITIPDGNSIRGVSTQTVTIQKTNVTANTNLMTMGENTRLEDVTLKLTSAGHYALNGLVFPGTTAVTAKLRTCVVTVDNRNAGTTGTSEVNGVLCNGTGTLGPSTFSFNCLKGSTINVYSNGNGKKRGILVNNSNIVTTRDLNVYVAKPTGPTGCTGSYVGVETNDVGGTGSIQMRSTTVGCVKPNTTIGATGELYTASDILQTTPTTIDNPTYLASSGIQIGPGTDLVTKSAGSKGFSTYIYPTTLFYGLKGNVSGANDGYLWPGTLKRDGTYPDATTPPAFYQIQQPAILSGIFVSLIEGPGTGSTVTILIQRTPVGGTISSTLFTVTLTGTDTTAYKYDGSIDFNSRDKLHVYFSNTGGGSAKDLSVQLDMF